MTNAGDNDYRALLATSKYCLVPRAVVLRLFAPRVVAIVLRAPTCRPPLALPPKHPRDFLETLTRTCLGTSCRIFGYYISRKSCILKPRIRGSS